MTTIDRAGLLRGTEFFRDVAPDALDDLAARCELRTLAEGEALFAKGEPGDALYVVASGSIQVHVDAAHIDNAGPGSCLGEMALFSGHPRSASARARTGSVVLSLSRESMVDALARNPRTLAWGIIRELADKVRSSIRVRVDLHDAQQALRDAFARSVSPALMDRLLASASPARILEAREVQTTVLFLDIRDSTTITERLPPRDAIRFVNTYLGPLVDVVLDSGGMIERFTGDGLKACYGVPLDDAAHAANAVRGAVAIRARMRELNELHRNDFPISCRVGVGLASGRAIAGCLGNERRLDFTIAGDVTNTGARVESLTKRYGTDLLMTDATVAAAGDGFSFRLVDRARLKGKTTPTPLYDVMPRERPTLAPKYAAAHAEYEAGDFARAGKSFARILAEFPDDGPSETLAARCAEFVKDPPERWAGVYDFKDK